MSFRIAEIAVTVASISAKTRWTFLEVVSEAGTAGVGEATLAGGEDALLEAARRLLSSLPGTDDRFEMMATQNMPGNLPEAAIRSALDQALRDLAARARGLPLWRGLAPSGQEAVSVYANINRRTVDRSPEGFANSAHAALTSGHDAFKMAPFDEATDDARATGALGPAIEQGFARIAAVREAIGEDRRLMIDCHWRFDEGSAKLVVARAAELGLHWVECPLPETPEHLSALRRLRELANARGVRLAGCETVIGAAGFAPFLKAGAYDVVMPDVKYAGGLDELMCLAETAARSGVLLSPHNPSGPVSHAVSLHVSSVLPGFDRLEMQFDESPLFVGLVREGFPPIIGGTTKVPAGPGCGVTLDAATLAVCTLRRVVFSADLSAGGVTEAAQ